MSERAVQDALEDARSELEKTIVVVAHRLNTIKNADVIVVLDEGVVVEKGSFDELMKIENGFFVNLVLAQQMDNDGMRVAEEEEEDPNVVQFVRGYQGKASRGRNSGSNDGNNNNNDDNNNGEDGASGSVIRRFSNKLRKSFRRPRRLVMRTPTSAASLRRRISASPSRAASLLRRTPRSLQPPSSPSSRSPRPLSLTSVGSGGSDGNGENAGYAQIYVRRPIRRGSTFSPIIARNLTIVGEPEYDTNDGLYASTENCDGDEEDEETLAAYADWKRLFKLNRPELGFIILGSFFSFIVGAIFPTFAVVFALNLDLLSNPESFMESSSSSSSSNALARVSLYVVIFVVIGVVDLVSRSIQGYCFGRSGQSLTTRLRSQFYSALLNQRVSWFDSPANSVGKLTTSLSSDCSLVQGTFVYFL